MPVSSVAFSFNVRPYITDADMDADMDADFEAAMWAAAKAGRCRFTLSNPL
jgi:hypothetical protein